MITLAPSMPEWFEDATWTVNAINIGGSRGPTRYARIHPSPESGIPRPALWLAFALAVFWTMPFPSWEALITVVSATLVLSYAIAPVSVAAPGACRAPPVRGSRPRNYRTAILCRRSRARDIAGGVGSRFRERQ